MSNGGRYLFKTICNLTFVEANLVELEKWAILGNVPSGKTLHIVFFF